MQKDLNNVNDSNGTLSSTISVLIAMGIETVHDFVSSFAFLTGYSAETALRNQIGIYNKAAEKAGGKVVPFIGKRFFITGGEEAVKNVDKAKAVLKKVNIAGCIGYIVWMIKVSIATLKDFKNFEKEAKKGNMDANKKNAVYIKLSRYCKELENCISKLEAKL